MNRRKHPTSIVLDEQLKAALKAEAVRQGRPTAQLIVFILTEYMGRLMLAKRLRKPKTKTVPLGVGE